MLSVCVAFTLPIASAQIGRCGPTLAVLFERWWSTFNRLPRAIRRVCLGRFPIEDGRRRKFNVLRGDVADVMELILEWGTELVNQTAANGL